MANKYKGEQLVTIGEKVYILFFDWQAVAEVLSAMGESVLAKLSEVGALKPDEMAKLLSIGLSKNHPEMTPEKILELSPPLVPTLAALDMALAIAFFGPEKVAPKKETEAKEPVKVEKKNAKKKTS